MKAVRIPRAIECWKITLDLKHVKRLSDCQQNYQINQRQYSTQGIKENSSERAVYYIYKYGVE